MKRTVIKLRAVNIHMMHVKGKDKRRYCVGLIKYCYSTVQTQVIMCFKITNHYPLTGKKIKKDTRTNYYWMGNAVANACVIHASIN